MGGPKRNSIEKNIYIVQRHSTRARALKSNFVDHWLFCMLWPLWKMSKKATQSSKNQIHFQHGVCFLCAPRAIVKIVVYIYFGMA